MGTIISIEQFNETYFPKQYEKERIRNISPEELGKYLVQKIMPEIKKILKN